MPESGQLQYSNPYHIASRNPALWYPDGLFDSYVAPQIVLSSRPEGAAFRPSSDYRQTVVPEVLKSPGARRRGKGFPFRPLYPDLPASPQAPVAVHDPQPSDTADPRTQNAINTNVENEVVPLTLWDRILGGWATSPIGMIFLALGAVVLANELFFRRVGAGGLTGGAARGARSTGAGVAGVGQAAAGGAQQTGQAGIDAVNKAVGGAVEAVEDIAK